MPSRRIDGGGEEDDDDELEDDDESESLDDESESESLEDSCDCFGSIFALKNRFTSSSLLITKLVSNSSTNGIWSPLCTYRPVDVRLLLTCSIVSVL